MRCSVQNRPATSAPWRSTVQAKWRRPEPAPPAAGILRYPGYSYVQYETLLPTSSSLVWLRHTDSRPIRSVFPGATSFIIGGTSQAGNGLEPAWVSRRGAGRCGSGCLSAATGERSSGESLTQDLKLDFPAFIRHIVDVLPRTIPVRGPSYTPGGVNPWTGRQCDSGMHPVGKNARGGTGPKTPATDSSTQPADVLAGHRTCKLNQVDWVISAASNPTMAIYRRLRTSGSS